MSEQTFVHLITFSSVDPGSGAFMTPGSGIRHGKNPIRDEHPRSFFRESLETVFLVKKYLLMRIRIRDLFDPGSGLNIPDPQHWLFLFFFSCCRIKPEDFQQERANSGCHVTACEIVRDFGSCFVRLGLWISRPQLLFHSLVLCVTLTSIFISWTLSTCLAPFLEEMQYKVLFSYGKYQNYVYWRLLI